MEAVFWTYRDPNEVEDNLYLQVQIINEFLQLNFITKMDLYLAIEFKVNSEDETAVNDVAMCKVEITQEKTNGETHWTAHSSEAIDTYVASTSGVYDENINLSSTSDVSADWQLLQNWNVTPGYYYTQVFCQSTHCYTSCLIERKIDLGQYNIEEDINYDIDLAVIDVKGIYYSFGYYNPPV